MLSSFFRCQRRKYIFSVCLLSTTFFCLITLRLYINSPASVSNQPGISYISPRDLFKFLEEDIFYPALKGIRNKGFKSAGNGILCHLIKDNIFTPNAYDFLNEINITSGHYGINRTRLEEFRTLFARSATEIGLPKSLMITQSNTNIGDNIYFSAMLGKVKIGRSLWNSLPKESLIKGKRYKKCSIVGSSGILTNSSCGKSIDEADLIIRFNLPIVEGFEQDVGRRADLITGNPSMVRTKFSNFNSEGKAEFVKRLSQFNSSFLIPLFSSKLSLHNGLKEMQVAQSHDQTKVVLLNPENFLAVWTFWEFAGFKSIISSGFYMITTMLNICDETNLFGFWPYITTPEGTPVRYHYYEPNIVGFTGTPHDYDREFRTLWRLQKLGLLKIHTKCDKNDSAPKL